MAKITTNYNEIIYIVSKFLLYFKTPNQIKIDDNKNKKKTTSNNINYYLRKNNKIRYFSFLLIVILDF